MAKILLILFELGFSVKYDIVGSMSISELFLVASSFYYISKTNFRNRDIRKLTQFYIFLFVAQAISEFFVGNMLSNALKGMAVTVVSYLHVIFLYYYLKRDYTLLLYCMIGIVLRIFVVGDFTGEEGIGSIEDNRFVFMLKFYIVPIVSGLLWIFAFIKPKWNIEVIAMALALTYIVLGARSGGTLLFITGMSSFLIKSKKRFGIKSFTPMIVTAFLVFMGGYYYYVDQVISGKITAGNSEQLLRLENPYNPINLLMTGRTESFVGVIAFMDRPLAGWGAWAEDPGWRYHILESQIGNKDEYNPRDPRNVNVYNIIPSHSVLIGTGVQNGILAFIAMLSIALFIIKRAIYTIKKIDINNIILISYFMGFCWNILFSPLSHFRFTLPLYMVFIIVKYQKHRYREEIQVASYLNK